MSFYQQPQFATQPFGMPPPTTALAQTANVAPKSNMGKNIAIGLLVLLVLAIIGAGVGFGIWWFFFRDNTDCDLECGDNGKAVKDDEGNCSCECSGGYTGTLCDTPPCDLTCDATKYQELGDGCACKLKSDWAGASNCNLQKTTDHGWVLCPPGFDTKYKLLVQNAADCDKEAGTCNKCIWTQSAEQASAIYNNVGADKIEWPNITKWAPPSGTAPMESGGTFYAWSRGDGTCKSPGTKPCSYVTDPMPASSAGCNIIDTSLLN